MILYQHSCWSWNYIPFFGTLYYIPFFKPYLKKKNRNTKLVDTNQLLMVNNLASKTNNKPANQSYHRVNFTSCLSLTLLGITVDPQLLQHYLIKKHKTQQKLYDLEEYCGSKRSVFQSSFSFAHINSSVDHAGVENSNKTLESLTGTVVSILIFLAT